MFRLVSAGRLRLQLLFRAYDLDGDGLLNSEELRNLLRHLHAVSTHEADKGLSAAALETKVQVRFCVGCGVNFSSLSGPSKRGDERLPRGVFLSLDGKRLAAAEPRSFRLLQFFPERLGQSA